MFFLPVVGEGRLLRAWSQPVSGLHVNKAVLREINDANSGLALARVYANDTTVIVEGCLPVQSLGAVDLGALCVEVGRAADRLGSLLAAVHGGRLAFPQTCDPDHDCED